MKVRNASAESAAVSKKTYPQKRRDRKLSALLDGTQANSKLFRRCGWNAALVWLTLTKKVVVAEAKRGAASLSTMWHIGI
jgi:hypothetical protein